MWGIIGKNKNSKTNDKKSSLFLYNTEKKKLEKFTPLSSRKPVRVYTCGPTVYDYAHIGNLRSFVFADILKRTLLYNNYKVEHTINFTDFGHLTDDADAGEDKILNRLKQENLPLTLQAMHDFTDTYIEAFQEDIAKLRIQAPTNWTRASDYVKEQIRLIKTLDEKGYTYETSDGVYFDIKKFPKYGRLGNIDISTLKSTNRVAPNLEKKHPADFAVWKKGILGWESPWGKGFPGWHIECSAMAIATLGRSIDIHTGGIDHIHTHHNAEIAQSEAATGKQFVQYWMHNAFLNIENTKISKSLGNTISLRNLEKRGYSADDYRYWLLTAHYRSPINFTFEALTAAKHALYRLKKHMIEDYKQKASSPDVSTMQKFTQAINNDLDTPQAIALLWETVKSETLDAKTKCATLQAIDNVLNIGLSDDIDSTKKSLGVLTYEEIPTTVQELIAKRKEARESKNWDQADSIREEINLLGYTVEDTPEGSKVTKNPPTL